MKKSVFAATGAGLIALLPFTAHAQFQLNKIFGGTKANHGSVLPEWWNETGYNPPDIDGKLHIRAGSAGENGRYAQLGRANCDWVYLWAAKSNTPLDPAEKEECAMSEFHIKRGIDGDKRNYADGFVKREIIAEMSQRVDARIAELRAAKMFYFRTAALKVDPYDFTLRSAPVKINWHGYSTNSASYVLRGRGFDDNTSWMKVPLFADEGTARLVEAARYGGANGYISEPHNIISFEVLGAKQVSSGARPTRAIEVLFREIAFRVVDSQNRFHRISIENTQKL